MPNVSDSEVNRFIEEAGPITMTASGNIEVSLEFLQSLVRKVIELDKHIEDRFDDHFERYEHKYRWHY